LTGERERHVLEGHSRVLPSVREVIAAALYDPDQVRNRPWRPGELLFVKRTEEGDVVVVVTLDDDPVDDQRPPRTWVVSAFPTRVEPLSAILWTKP